MMRCFISAGVEKALQILHVRKSLRPFILRGSMTDQVLPDQTDIQPKQDEFEMNMRLLGAPTLKDVVPAMVDASSLSNHSVAVPEDRLFGVNCESYAAISSSKLKVTRESHYALSNNLPYV